MITLTIVGAIAVILTLITPSNPVKMSFILIVLSMILFMQLVTVTTSIWMSSIFFMIFIGGIMIMFMILSSLLPNEKEMKIKKAIFLSLMVGLGFSAMAKSGGQMESNFNQESKVVFLSNQSFEILMLVILTYFLSFVYIVSKQTTTLRSFLC